MDTRYIDRCKEILYPPDGIQYCEDCVNFKAPIFRKTYARCMASYECRWVKPEIKNEDLPVYRAARKKAEREISHTYCSTMRADSKTCPKFEPKPAPWWRKIFKSKA